MPFPIPLPELTPDAPVFRTTDGVREAIESACRLSGGVARFEEMGASEEGRPVYAVTMGHGPRRVSLIAGAHADEPVGPETLRTFILGTLAHAEAFAPMWEAFTFVVVPHVNPDGEARNRPWIEAWPDLGAYLAHVDRERPGRDVEFGFPSMRVENRLVTELLRRHAPLAAHLSLHGMAFSEGAMLLVERHWAGARTEALRAGFATAAADVGLPLHDHNRKGEKGFFYIEPGFTTTPEGAAMRAHFLALGDEAMAARFHSSSMEQARSLGGDPLCLVTELPLFLLPQPATTEPGVPASYLAWRDELPGLKHAATRGGEVAAVAERFGVEPLSLSTAMHLQLRVVELALDRVGGRRTR